MKNYFILVCLIIGTPALAGEACRHDPSTFRCVKYVKNYDADTITFDIDGIHPLIGSRIAIRLAGVDSPEIKTKDICEKKMAYQARDFVRGLMKRAKRIDLVNVERGKYFRIVAEVLVDGQALSLKLLKHGFAYAYKGGTKRTINWCKSMKEGL